MIKSGYFILMLWLVWTFPLDYKFSKNNNLPTLQRFKKLPATKGLSSQFIPVASLHNYGFRPVIGLCYFMNSPPKTSILFFSKDLFTEKEREKNSSLFLKQMLTRMVFCNKSGWDTFNLKLSWISFSNAAHLINGHVSSCGLPDDQLCFMWAASQKEKEMVANA